MKSQSSSREDLRKLNNPEDQRAYYDTDEPLPEIQVGRLKNPVHEIWRRHQEGRQKRPEPHICSKRVLSSVTWLKTERNSSLPIRLQNEERDLSC